MGRVSLALAEVSAKIFGCFYSNDLLWVVLVGMIINLADIGVFVIWLRLYGFVIECLLNASNFSVKSGIRLNFDGWRDIIVHVLIHSVVVERMCTLIYLIEWIIKGQWDYYIVLYYLL